jgi:hypothetical protein
MSTSESELRALVAEGLRSELMRLLRWRDEQRRVLEEVLQVRKKWMGHFDHALTHLRALRQNQIAIERAMLGNQSMIDDIEVRLEKQP